jgi:hypothetical protein
MKGEHGAFRQRCRIRNGGIECCAAKLCVFAQLVIPACLNLRQNRGLTAEFHEAFQ